MPDATSPPKKNIVPLLIVLAVTLGLVALAGHAIYRHAAGQPDRPRTGALEPRVASMSPAITGILRDCGWEGHLVGVTRFCNLPQGMERPILGDALSYDAEAILNVDPDLLLTQSSAEKFRGLTDLDGDIRVVPLRIETLDDLKQAVERIGALLGRAEIASVQVRAMEMQLDRISLAVEDRPAPRVLFVMGTDRPNAIGPGTFVHDMILIAGGVNALAPRAGHLPAEQVPAEQRWVSTHIEAIAAAQPDVILCQVPPEQRRMATAYWQQWKDIPAVRTGRVHVVTDPGWTIPALSLPARAAELARWLHPGAAVPAVAGPGEAR
jgi:iron complex transport system substrate-binding protein